jgi:hypothetical protein
MKSQLLNEELNRIKKIMFKPELLEESLAQLAKGTLDNIIKVAVDDALTKILKSYTDDVLSKMIKLGSATDEVTKRLTSSTEFNKLTKDIEKNIGQKLGKSNYTLSGLDKVTLRAQLTDSIQKTADKVIRQKKVGIDALGKTAQKGGKEAGEKFVSTIGKEAGEKLGTTISKGGELVVQPLTKKGGEEVLQKNLMIIQNLDVPKKIDFTPAMKKKFLKDVEDLVVVNGQAVKETIEAGKNLGIKSMKQRFLDNLTKLGLLTIKENGKKQLTKKGMLAAAGILGLGSVVFAYYMGGEAEKDGVDITEIDKDTREMAADLKELAEKKWILLDPEFGKRLKKALNKNPEEQFTDQDIDDIYKKLTDLKVIQ